jgi:aminoglycoside phosphotransferase (APT) family kinase protein
LSGELSDAPSATNAGLQDPGASPVDLSALNEMLAPAYPGRRVVDAELLSGGFANANFKVSLSNVDAPVVVRVYLRDPSAAYREASILELVKKRVPVPEVLYVSPEAREPHTYLILRWVDGIPLEQLVAEGASSDARRAVRATGSVLAKLQDFRFASSGFFGRTLDIRTPFPSESRVVVGVLEQCLFRDSGEERLGVDLTQRLWRFVTEHEEVLDVIEHHAMLVHGDFNGLNVMVRTAPDLPEVAALLDWEYAHSGTPLVDLGSMLRRPGRELPPWFEKEFIRGYRQEGGVLPENWRQVSRIVDLVKLCAFVRSPNAGEVAITSVRALIEAALADEHQ